MSQNAMLADDLMAKSELLAKLTLQMHKDQSVGSIKFYSSTQDAHYLNDTKTTIRYLADSIRLDQPLFFYSYIKWFSEFLPSIGVPVSDMQRHFHILEQAARLELSVEILNKIHPLLQYAIKNIASTPAETSSMDDVQSSFNDLAQEYLQLLLHGKRSDAVRLVLKEVENGTKVKDIYLNVFQNTQYQVGRLWQTNKITVAQEHFITAAIQYAMSHLYPYIFNEQPGDNKLVSTCVQGELHELGARMVTDFFEMEGWDTNYLGANTPSNAVASFVHQKQPHVVAVSATLMTNVHAVTELINEIKKVDTANYHPLIMVGGYPFKTVPGLWAKVGADAYAIDAQEAMKVADRHIKSL